MKNEDYISNQIAVYKNSKTLVEFQDKLKSAGIHSYAHIHANGEIDADGRKRYSLIGILMKDYSKGTGDKAVTVSANLSPGAGKVFPLQDRSLRRKLQFFGRKDIWFPPIKTAMHRSQNSN